MEEVRFDTSLLDIVIIEEGKPKRVARGALVGKTLQFGDEKRFVMPSEVVVTTIVHYDFQHGCFFSAETGKIVHSADVALLYQGLTVAGWINRI